jgi:DNA-binding PadR family transcriptional regulator
MEEKGWIKAAWKKSESGRERRYYKLSGKGREQLNEQVTQWNFINQLIQQLWDPKSSIFKLQ